MGYNPTRERYITLDVYDLLALLRTKHSEIPEEDTSVDVLYEGSEMGGSDRISVRWTEVVKT